MHTQPSAVADTLRLLSVEINGELAFLVGMAITGASCEGFEQLDEQTIAADDVTLAFEGGSSLVIGVIEGRLSLISED